MKPWYKRRRYWAVALLVVLVYFCLIPMPLQISSETTGITEPRLPNGNVDYFGYYERLYIHKLSPPEDNGLRLIIAALGPLVLEATSIAYDIPWEEVPERSKWWFEKRWVPLCEHMGIDPHAKPHFLDNFDFHRFLRKEWEANAENDDARSAPGADEKFRQQLAAAPWTAEEYPDIARWLEERAPVLDLFGVAVRKPNFVSYRWRPENGGLTHILLPDVQSQRQFARELRVRITERLGRGDVDGAWYDVMSMLILSRHHYIHDPFVVVNLVGIASEGIGGQAVPLILQHGNPTPEQLEQFAQDLDSLPRRTALPSKLEYAELERAVIYDVLQGTCDRDKEIFSFFFGGDECCGRGKTSWDKTMLNNITLLPIDRNIAGKRIAEFLQTGEQMSIEARNRMHAEKIRRVESVWSMLRVPLIRTRSQLVADQVIAKAGAFAFDDTPAQNAFDQSNVRFDLLRLAVALERHKAASGDYPATLDELVPAYLAEVPLDPFTDGKPLTYKRAPDTETAFLIHSAEWDENVWLKKELSLRMRR